MSCINNSRPHETLLLGVAYTAEVVLHFWTCKLEPASCRRVRVRMIRTILQFQILQLQMLLPDIHLISTWIISLKAAKSKRVYPYDSAIETTQ